jgi:hypothetical protein
LIPIPNGTGAVVAQSAINDFNMAFLKVAFDQYGVEMIAVLGLKGAIHN